jgi:hypothetical protein
VGLVAGLVLTVIVLGATTYAVSTAEATAREALEQEKAQKERAEANYLQARKVLDLVTRVGVEELDDRPEFQRVRRKLLTELLAYYEEFIAQHASEPQVAAELIETRLQVANLLAEMGKREEGMAEFERAMRDREGMPGGPPPHLFGGPGRGLMRIVLLGQPDVRKELNLTAEQLAALGPLPKGGRKGRPHDGMMEAEKAAEDALTPEQSKRLRQIMRQLRGPEALLDAADSLGLSDWQVGEIRKWAFRGGPRGRSDADRRQAEERALQVLRPDQRQKWQELLGEPFRGEVRFFGPPPRHPPPPR